YKAAKRLSDRRLYVTGINLTQRLLERTQVAAAEEMLDALRPEETDNVDLRGWEWYHLKRLCHPELLRLEGHRGPVRCVAFAPGGALLATGGGDGTARLWDAATGRPLHVLR